MPKSSPDLVHVLPEDHAIRAGKVDELENTKGVLDFFKRSNRFQSFFVYQKDFSWLNVPQIFGTYHIKGTGLRCYHPGIFELPQCQRSPAIRVPGCQDGISRDEN